MKEISRRLAIDNDVDTIAIITEHNEPHGLDKYKDSFAKQVAGNLKDDSLGKVFVALIGDEIVGYGKLLKYSSEVLKVDYDSPDGWYLNGVIVEERYRRKGVAKELLKCREKFIQNDKNNMDLFSIVSTENIPSIKYHLSLGFSEKKRAEGFLSVKLKCGEGILFYKKVCLT